MKVEIKEQGQAYGVLTVRKCYPDGRMETIFEDDPNLITRKSKQHHLSFLFDETAVPDILQSFKVGIGGTIDPEGQRPIKPDPSRNDLYQPLVINHNDITIIPAPAGSPQVYMTVVFSLNQDEGNDQQINEVALFKKSGDMFNIKTFRAVPKTESFSLMFEWKIIYV